MTREMSVNGSFYPSSKEELKKYFSHFEKLWTEFKKDTAIASRVVIVPHAGYVFSGFSASLSYKALQNSSLKRFLVVGPSHKYGFNGFSLCDFDSYQTPFGEIKGDKELYSLLKQKFDFNCYAQVHSEHSTEVQFPFIKYYLSDAKIVELVYSKQNPFELSKILEYALSFDDIGVIISTDLSHFYTQEKAKHLDSICIDGVLNLDNSKLDSGCEACGIIGVKAIVEVAKTKGLKPVVLDYRTSADASGDTSRVVGYLSTAFV